MLLTSLRPHTGKCTCAHMYSIIIKLSFRLCKHSFTNMYSPLSHGHYHIHLARRYPPPPYSIRWPLGLPSSHAGHLCLRLFVSERLFWLQRPMEGWNQGTLELPQKRSLETTFELELTFQTIPDLCVSISFTRFLHARIHATYTSTVSFHQRLVPIPESSSKSDPCSSC